MAKPPIDFNAIRIGLVRVLKLVTNCECIEEEQARQNVQRPPLPYFSFKMVTAAAKVGDDHMTQTPGSSVVGRGGQRKMSVSFHCYGVEKEDALSLMALWQGSLELNSVQESLRRAGVAVWTIGNVADLSSLLNTGFEARAQMDCSFGIASNLTEDQGYIQTIDITGSVKLEDGATDITTTTQVPKPAGG